MRLLFTASLTFFNISNDPMNQNYKFIRIETRLSEKSLCSSVFTLCNFVV
jgi:hypothetical protein